MMADDTGESAGDERTAGTDAGEKVSAGAMSAWDVGELPEPPPFRLDPRRIIGPGLVMAGLAMGAGEWLTGPALTAQYGGTLMWVALTSILFQVAYNLEVMRYTLYCGESIFVGFFRIRPGPAFWTCAYLVLDFGVLWPYLAANAAVPLSAAFLGHLPTDLPTKYLSVADVAAESGVPIAVVQEMADYPQQFATVETVLKETQLSANVVREMAEHPEEYGDVTDRKPMPRAVYERWIEPEEKLTHWLGYAIFLAAFVPLFFGGKIYNTIEKILVAKVFILLGYMSFLAVMYVDWVNWQEIFSGFFRFGALPVVEGHQITWSELFAGFIGTGEQPPLDIALVATFAAIAGTGGLSGVTFSSYVRDKGWGMGKHVGAIPSAVGGGSVALAHTGIVFRVTDSTQRVWKRWRNLTLRDQLGVCLFGSVMGIALPALVSLQFVKGQEVKGHSLAALTAQGVVDNTGIELFWFLTLFCGFIVLGPGQVTTVEGFARRWTDVIWVGSRRLRHASGEQAKYVFYSLLIFSGVWGLVVLTLFPDPLTIVKIAGQLFNFALGLSALHVLYVNVRLLPRELRPNWFVRLCMILCAVFFTGIGTVAMTTLLRELKVF